MAEAMIVPVNVAIKRYYRCYATVDSDANDDLIIKQIKEDIVAHQDDALTNDPDLFIEEDDICGMDIDHDASWTETEDDDIKEIVSKVREVSMVEATVQMRDGTVKTAYARTFEGLFRKLDGLDFVKITGKTTTLKDMRQGKESLNSGEFVSD